MSNNTCITCEHYNQAPIVKFEGECTDPTKIILIHGNPLNNSPSVFDWSTCRNHKYLKGKGE